MKFIWHIYQALCKQTQHCWMLRVASVCTPSCMLLHVVGSCCVSLHVALHDINNTELTPEI